MVELLLIAEERGVYTYVFIRIYIYIYIFHKNI
jgi:hypothetical protein